MKQFPPLYVVTSDEICHFAGHHKTFSSPKRFTCIIIGADKFDMDTGHGDQQQNVEFSNHQVATPVECTYKCMCVWTIGSF